MLLFLVLAGNFDFYVVTHSYSSRPFLCILAWYYSDNDFIIRTFDFIAHSDAARVTCSTWIWILTWLVVLIRILVWLVHVVKYAAFYKLHAATRLPHWLPYIRVAYDKWYAATVDQENSLSQSRPNHENEKFNTWKLTYKAMNKHVCMSTPLR